MCVGSDRLWEGGLEALPYSVVPGHVFDLDSVHQQQLNSGTPVQRDAFGTLVRPSGAGLTVLLGV